jgi:hypothetical protein
VHIFTFIQSLRATNRLLSNGFLNMIKKLMFMTALLVPGFAYGQNPSALLTVQVVPSSGSIACGIGPNYNGSIPVGAQAAGFTTCAANYDFTSSAYANTSTWLDCAGATNPQWYHTIWWAAASPPCTVQIVNDSVAGSNVLDFTWLPSYGTKGGSTNGFQAMETMIHDGSIATDFPDAYIEIEYRITPVLANTYSSLYTWTRLGALGTGAIIEWDDIETYGTTRYADDAACHNWSNGSGCNGFLWHGSGPSDISQYHKYAMRITGDGSTAIYACSYVDGNFIGHCVNGVPNAGEFSVRNFLIVGVGSYSGQPSGQVDMLVKSIRVWSCANWRTTMCSGTVLTGAP